MKESISSIKENYKKRERIKSKVQRKKDDEDIAPEIDKINNRRMRGEVSDKEYENQSYAYKVDQSQENKTPKEKCDTIAELDNVLQINYPLPNKWKMQKENSKEENEEASYTQNGNDYELSDTDPLTKLSDEELEEFSTLF